MDVQSEQPPSTPNFSYKKIVTGKVVIVPEYQQMIVHDNITLDGTLILKEGAELVLML